MTYSATYSPDDNKIRLYASTRLDAETYARAKAAGFRWAPKQDLFFAYWSPGAEDLATELAGEIDDDDRSLVDRAEDRADRFEGYGEKRTADAERAREAVHAIADNIPFGQPILVGHHSEKRARKDAERIENGMRKAVKMWETAGYWKGRAAGAIRTAKYKELPAVRARRIKTLEADLRKVERNKAIAETFAKLWRTPGLTYEQAKAIANRDHLLGFCFSAAEYPKPDGGFAYEGRMSVWSALDDKRITAEQAAALCIPAHEGYLPHAQRWIDHYNHRLDYERAMLAESGGTVADQTKPEKGGAVRCWCGPRNGWAYIQKVNKVTVTVHQAANYGDRVFRSNVPLDKLHGIMSSAQVQEARDAGRIIEADKGTGFYLSDGAPAERPAPIAPQPDAAPFEAMRESLKAGVKTVSAPQLFPTPADLARRMAEAAGILAGKRILEPSAGTGNLIRAAYGNATGADCCRVVAVEINPTLAEGLGEQRNKTVGANASNFRVVCCDFLEIDGPTAITPAKTQPAPLGLFDVVLMNPPFANQADVKHVTHALRFLKPGGRLVAIMSAGVTFRTNELSREFHQLVCDRRGTIVDLPEGSFAEAGTAVRVVLVTIDAPQAAKQPDELAGQLALL